MLSRDSGPPVRSASTSGPTRAYRSQYWPALYLIDATGTIRHINAET
jgi:hypothetical protein